MEKPQEAPPVKLPYNSPQLTVFGNVRDLTGHSGNTGMKDGASFGKTKTGSP
jgi:hypothetical protein